MTYSSGSLLSLRGSVLYLLNIGARENQYPWTAGKRSQLPGFNVVRVGQENKIHPHVHCISLDELARKILAKGTVIAIPDHCRPA